VNWTIEKISPVLLKLNGSYQRSQDYESWILLTSDRHIDSKLSDLKLQQKHMKQALERGAAIVDLGDVFDAMQGRNDKRRTKDDLRPELLGENYLNRLVDFAYELFKPYQSNLVMLGQGNHDTSVRRHTEFDLNENLVGMLRRSGSPVISGGYRGWISIPIAYASAEGKLHGGSRCFQLYYHHGYGGGGPVTKGVIQASRKAVYLPDADIVVSGHIHEQWAMAMTRTRISKTGVELIDTQWHASVPTYKDEHSNQSGGWHHERGGPPKPIGAWWIRFYWDGERIQVQMLPADV
jgi:UDP-2,3-diacylglucosamine pyrophosphatase LpxH